MSRANIGAMRYGLAVTAAMLSVLRALAQRAMALDVSDDFTITGYGDVRAWSRPILPSWLNGGLGKFRYGGNAEIRRRRRWRRPT